MKMSMFVLLTNYVKITYTIILVNIMKIMFIVQKNVIEMFGTIIKKMNNNIRYVISIVLIAHQLNQEEKNIIMFQVQ